MLSHIIPYDPLSAYDLYSSYLHYLQEAKSSMLNEEGISEKAV